MRIKKFLSAKCWPFSAFGVVQKRFYFTVVGGSICRLGQKSKLLILSECVNNTEKIGGMWTNKNSYREKEVGPIVWYFHVKYFMSVVLCLNILWLKAINEIIATQTRTSLCKHDVIKGISAVNFVSTPGSVCNCPLHDCFNCLFVAPSAAHPACDLYYARKEALNRNRCSIVYR